jgi:hypothetical protein
MDLTRFRFIDDLAGRLSLCNRGHHDVVVRPLNGQADGGEGNCVNRVAGCRARGRAVGLN